jgi:hypothetical protein
VSLDAGDARCIDVERALPLHSPAAFAAALYTVMHVPSQHGEDPLAATASVLDGLEEIGVAPVALFLAEVAAPDVVASCPETRGPIVSEKHQVLVGNFVHERAEACCRVRK